MHMVTAADSPEFSSSDGPSALPVRWPRCRVEAHLEPPRRRERRRWRRSHLCRVSRSGLPHRDLLQIACRVRRKPSDSAVGNSLVFLVVLLSVPLPAIYEVLGEMFVAPSVVKLGFRFKWDLIYLSSTFSSQGCHPGFIECTKCNGSFIEKHGPLRKLWQLQQSPESFLPASSAGTDFSNAWIATNFIWSLLLPHDKLLVNSFWPRTEEGYFYAGNPVPSINSESITICNLNDSANLFSNSVCWTRP